LTQLRALQISTGSRNGNGAAKAGGTTEEVKKEAAINDSKHCDDAFEREMSRNMHMQGARKIKFEDISFESETHNIYEPFYSSESDDGDYYSNTSDEHVLSDYDSESQRSSRDVDESSYTSSNSRNNN